MKAKDARPALTEHGSASRDQPNELVRHLALAANWYVRYLRQEGVQVPPSLEELAALLVRCLQTRPTPTPVEHTLTAWNRATQHGRLTDRLLVTKAEAAQMLGVSVRTIERLISAGQLPLLHIERASRLRLADLQAYVDGLIR